MKNSISLSAINKTLSRFLHRYHVVIFVLFALGGLAVITLLLNNIITRASTITETPQVTGFDQTTVEKIEQLKTASESDQSAAQLSISQRNPFTE